MPQVSVITPAWNAAGYIAETIDSVRAQTFSDWELIVVDDGSTDGTAAVVESFAANDQRVRLLRQANAGPAAARNHAMREAHGRFFAILDSDDVWQPEFLAAQLAVFDTHPDTGLVTANGLFLGGPFDGQPTRPIGPGYPVLPLTELVANESAVFIMTVFRRAVFETVGGFNETKWTSEDYEFWIRAALAGFVFRRNPQPLGWYRVRDNSLSRDRTRMLRGILDTFGNTRPQFPAGSEALRALDAQVARFESELLLEEAKTALDAGDCGRAADRLRALRARGGGLAVGVTAWLAEHMPQAALFAYRARSWRPSRLRPRGRHVPAATGVNA